MDKVIESAKELKAELDKLPLFQEYKRVKALYDNDEEIKELKKQVVRAKNENRLEDHHLLLETLHNHPLYINYTELHEEVEDYLKEITNYLK